MAIAFVRTQVTASEITGTGTYTTGAFAAAPTVGNTLFAMVSSDGNTNNITAISDTQGNTWTQDFIRQDTRAVSIWRAPVTSAAAGMTVTVTYNGASSNNSGVIVQEFSSATALTLDQTKGGTGTSATPTTGASAATTNANEVVIAGSVMTSTEASFTGAGAGYSNAVGVIVSAANVAMESAVISSTGAQTATFSWPTSRIYSALLATYYEAAGGGGVTAHNLTTMGVGA